MESTKKDAKNGVFHESIRPGWFKNLPATWPPEYDRYRKLYTHFSSVVDSKPPQWKRYGGTLFKDGRSFFKLSFISKSVTIRVKGLCSSYIQVTVPTDFH